MLKTRMLVAVLVLLMAGAPYASEPVNINTADAAALSEAIKGEGLKKAQAIIAYRSKLGPFKSVNETALERQ